MSDLYQLGQHPDADQLNAFVEQALPAHEREETLAHLALCPVCRNVVALSLPQVEASPMPQPEAPRRPWFAGWALAWPAAAAIAVLTFFVMRSHDTAVRRPLGKAPIQIADSRPPALSTSPPLSASKPARTRSSKSAEEAPDESKPLRADAVSPAQTLDSLTMRKRSVPELEQQPSGEAIGGQIKKIPRGLARSVEDSASQHPQPATISPSTPAPASLASETVNVSPIGPLPQTTNATPTVNISPGTAGIALEARNFLSSSPLPSHLAVLSMASSGHRRVAVDTGNTLYFSSDDGQHWQAVPSQWTGRAVRVTLNFSSVYATDSPVITMRPYLIGTTISALAGIVTDPSGATIPGVTIAAANLRTSLVRTVTTDQSGRYRIDNAATGSYRVDAAASGFKQQSFVLDLVPGQQSIADIRLAVAAASQTVEVTSSVTPSAGPQRAAAKAKDASATNAVSFHFEITTNSGDHWMSTNGQTWKRK